MNDAYAIGAHGVAGADEIGSVGRVGDHDVASGHNAVVQALELAPFRIGAMISRDKRRARTPRSQQRAPSWCAASGVQQIDTLGLDEAVQRTRVRQHAERIFGADGHAHDLATGVRQATHHASAVGSNQSPAAGTHDGLGDLERGELGPSGVEPRNDLQYGRPYDCQRIAPGSPCWFLE